jgi:ubiquinone/menaquinone biosynthesis C-methylase UbiE
MGILKELTQKRLENARNPSGRMGEFLVRAMSISHHRGTQWGLSHLTIQKQDTVLDIGCGGGYTVHRLAKLAQNGKVYGIDYSGESVRVSRRTNKRFIRMGRVEIQQSSVSSLPFSDNWFDLITAVNTHNYWPDLATDLKEVFRVLKPGGRFILIGSVYKGGISDFRNQKYAELIEIIFPSIKEIRGHLSRAGFSEVEWFENPDRSWMCVIGKKT